MIAFLATLVWAQTPPSDPAGQGGQPTIPSQGAQGQGGQGQPGQGQGGQGASTYGKPVSVTLGVKEAEGVAAAGTYTFELTPREGAATKYTLADDGKEGDETAGDKRYTRMATLPTGPYTLVASVANGKEQVFTGEVVVPENDPKPRLAVVRSTAGARLWAAKTEGAQPSQGQPGQGQGGQGQGGQGQGGQGQGGQGQQGQVPGQGAQVVPTGGGVPGQQAAGAAVVTPGATEGALQQPRRSGGGGWGKIAFGATLAAFGIGLGTALFTSQRRRRYAVVPLGSGPAATAFGVPVEPGGTVWVAPDPAAADELLAILVEDLAPSMKTLVVLSPESKDVLGGPLAARNGHAVMLPGSRPTAQTVARAAKAMGERVVILVDGPGSLEAPLKDEASAAVLDELLAAATAPVIVVIREGQPIPGRAAQVFRVRREGSRLRPDK